MIKLHFVHYIINRLCVRLCVMFDLCENQEVFFTNEDRIT